MKPAQSALHLFLLGVLVSMSAVTGKAAQTTGGTVETVFFCVFIAMLVAYIFVMAFDIVWSTRPRMAAPVPLTRFERRLRLREYLAAGGGR